MVRDALSEDLSFRDVQNREERDCTVPDVLRLVVSGRVGFGGQGWGEAFEGLDARAFVQAE